MPEITKIEASVPVVQARKRVAAYARVSVESDQMRHSLSAQVSYYSALIQKNPEWEYVGVFADYGISGTSTAKRTQFQEMIAAAERGEIDIILTKSIQRFARNTVDLLNTVRHLKDIGVEVRFERENINSMSGDGELMLSILASFAQEEARGLSDNIKWSLQKRMEDGLPTCKHAPYGYVWEGDELIVVPEEAEVVKRIFREYLSGSNRMEIARGLTADGYTEKGGHPWTSQTLRGVLSNVTYTGNLLLQKTYVVDPIGKKVKKNHGERPQYFVENSHEAIIDQDTFDKVQQEVERRKSLGQLANKALNTSCFTGKMRCPACGFNYVSTGGSPRKWACRTMGIPEVKCPIGGIIPQDKIVAACNDVLGMTDFDESEFLNRVDYILVPVRHQLEFHLYDGTVAVRNAAPTGNTDRWTAEARKASSEWRKKNPCHRADLTCLTTKIRCHQCDCNFRRTANPSGNGSGAIWYCSNPGKPCRTKGFREDAVKQLSAQVMGLAEFDEDEFLRQMDYIDVLSASEVAFHFNDGRVETRPWIRPKRTKGPARVKEQDGVVEGGDA